MIYILYHSKCYDGFGSAFCAWKKYGDTAKYIPVAYGNPMPEIPDNSRVYIIDFSYPKDELLKLAERSEFVTVLDHHKTAEEALKDIKHEKLYVKFDMTKSGALLAAEFFQPNETPPLLIQHISDRDLWLFKMDKSQEVHEALVSYPMDFKVWDSLQVEKLKHEGEACARLYSKLVDNICENAYLKRIAGYTVPVVNTSIAWSEVGVKLLELYPDSLFAASFTIFEDTEMWSLRCNDNFDVSEIAKKFGGGGHKKASGFKTPRT